MTLTKAELADMLFDKVGLNKREAKDMVEAFFEEVRGALRGYEGFLRELTKATVDKAQLNGQQSQG